MLIVRCFHIIFFPKFLLSWFGARSWCQEFFSNHFCSSGHAGRTIEKLSQFCPPKLLIFHAQCRKTIWFILFPEKNMFKTFSWKFKLVLTNPSETLWWLLEVFLLEVGKKYGKVKILQRHSSPPISSWTSQMHVWQACPKRFAKERKVYQSPKQNLDLFLVPEKKHNTTKCSSGEVECRPDSPSETLWLVFFWKTRKRYRIKPCAWLCN